MAQLTTSWQRISTISITHGEIRTYAKYSSQSTATNKTTYQIRMTCYANQWFSFSSATARLDGTTKGYGSTTFGTGETTILEVSRTITHNSNGSSPTKNIATSWTATYGGGGSTSANVTFPAIKRQATITNSPASLTDEDTPWFSYSNPANYPMSCWLEVNPTGTHLATRTLSGSSGTFTWDLTQEEREQIRSQMPNSNTGKIRIGLYTNISGTQLASYVDRTFTIVNANPIFNDFTFEDMNATTLALTGNNQDIIKGYSKIKATITTSNKAIAQKGASMVKYRLSIGDSSVDIAYNDEETVSSMINNVTTGTINVYAVDSRNNSTMVTKLANREVNYDAVYTNINNSSFQRDDNRVGDNGVLTLNGTFWNDDFGNENNSLAVSYRFKKSDSDAWINGTTAIVPTISQNTFTFNGMIASDNQDTTWDLQSSYDLEITISDELTTSITNYVLASAIPTLSLDKEGVGIMCQYDTSIGGGLQVYGEPVGSSGNEIIVDWTATENTRDKVFYNLDMKPGENYKFRIVGCATANADIYLRFNGVQTQYYMVGNYENGTGTSSDINTSRYAGYRPNKTGMYYANHISTHLTVIDGTISIKYNPEFSRYCPFFTWKTQICWSGHQVFSDVCGVYGAADVQNITSLAFVGPTFKTGTRIQIVKVNDDFTI